MKETNMDDMEFNSDEELVNYLNEKTKKFNIIDFYNQNNPEDVSGLIVITPEQIIETHPISYHQYAADMIFELLYDITYDDNATVETNNIMIRLVYGSSYQFYCIMPQTITTYQKEVLQNLIELLNNYGQDISFPDYYTQMLFSETYEESKMKLENVKVVDSIDNIKKDKYIITNYQKVKER